MRTDTGLRRAACLGLAALAALSCEDDPAPLRVTVAEPADGARLLGWVWFEARVEPETAEPAGLRFLLDGAVVAELDGPRPRALLRLDSLAAGGHEFRVEARAADGGAASARIAFERLAHPLEAPWLELRCAADTVACGERVEQELWLGGLNGLQGGALRLSGLPGDVDSVTFAFDPDYAFDLPFALVSGARVDLAFAEVAGHAPRAGELRLGVLGWTPVFPGDQALFLEDLDLRDAGGDPLPRFDERTVTIETPFVRE